MKKLFSQIALVLAILLPAFSVSAQIIPVKPTVSQIEDGFKNVPDSIRIGVYWYWISDNISEEGVVKDLKAMKEAGITRAQLGSMGVDGVPCGNVKFMSPEWWKITRTALRTATELGIEIGIFNCPGWSQSGGPWIKEEQSMRYISCDEQIIEGNGTVKEIRIPKGGQLVSVLAFPTPEGESFDTTFVGTDAVDITLDKPMTVRSLTVSSSSPVISRMRLCQGDKVLSIFHFNRSNFDVSVGFNPYAPVVIAIPEVNGTDFRFEVDNPGASKFKLRLSETPKVERYAEKSLAKMFQTPLPMWGEYMWETPDISIDDKGKVSLSDIRDLTSSVKDGKICWNAPKGKWTVATYSMKTTGIKNSPAVPEATGLEVDKMSRKHIEDHFENYLGKIWRNIPQEERVSWKLVVEDSYEKGGLNWTDDMKEVFECTYGYNPLPYLPVLSGTIVGNEEVSDRFLWDLRRLVADRVAYDYVGGLRDVSHKYGLKTWLENYGHWGFPGEFLMYGGQSDQISGEFWSEGNLGDIENKAASSAGHIYGKNQIWAESCTSGGPAFSRYPRIMKQRIDRFFTEGINSSLLHLYIQQPDDRKPGLDAWFGNEFNRNNSWYGCMDLFTGYLRRCNYLLQQGTYASDVAYFIGEDAPKMTGECVPALPYGYSFDYINGEVLKNKAHVEDGYLVLESGVRYKVLVLPQQKTMRPEMLECISKLVRDGLTIVGPAPVKSPSLQGWPTADNNVQNLASELWHGKTGKGRVYADGTNLEKIFQDLKETPDFKVQLSGSPIITPITASDNKSESQVAQSETQDTQPKTQNIQPNILFIHRTLGGEGDIYFVSNQDDKAILVNASFKVDKTLVPELWDPVTSETKPVDYTVNGNYTTIALPMDRVQSLFVVFRKKESNIQTSEQTESITIQGGNVRKIPLTGKWNIDFEQSCGNEGFTIVSDTLIDWKNSTDNKVKYYGGTANYKINCKLSASDLKSKKIELDLGLAMVIAKVKINGVYAGGTWTYPYKVNITGLLHKGNNTVEVAVSNNWQNRLIGDKHLPENERLTLTNVNPWESNSELQSSGLLGPVNILLYSR